MIDRTKKIKKKLRKKYRVFTHIYLLCLDNQHREDEGDGQQAGEGQHVVEPGGADTRHVEQGEEHHLDSKGVNKVSLTHLLNTSHRIDDIDIISIKRLSQKLG